MDYMDSRGSDFDIDLESGGTVSEEEGSKDHGLNGKNAKKLLSNIRSGYMELGGSIKGKDGLSSYEVLNFGEIAFLNPEILSDKCGEEMVCFVEKVRAKEKKKKPNSVKPPKPPRPPRGPSLNAADMKLIKEISEVAMAKHRRIEWMKALKKKKKLDKKTSFINNTLAMLVTVLFCFVIISQGILGSHV